MRRFLVLMALSYTGMLGGCAEPYQYTAGSYYDRYDPYQPACRTYRGTAYQGFQPQEAEITACINNRGRWQIVSERPVVTMSAPRPVYPSPEPALPPPAPSPPTATGLAGDLQAGQSVEFEYAPGENPDREVRCHIPGGFSIGVMTLARIRGAGYQDIELAHDVRQYEQGHLEPVDTIDTSNGPSDYPKLVLMPPQLDNAVLIGVVHARSPTAAHYRLYCDSASIPWEFVKAATVTALDNAWRSQVGNTNSPTADMIERAFNAAISYAQRDNVMAFGVDAAINEAGMQLRKQFPDSPETVVFFTTLYQDIIQDVYAHAFYEMSPSAGRNG